MPAFNKTYSFESGEALSDWTFTHPDGTVGTPQIGKTARKWNINSGTTPSSGVGPLESQSGTYYLYNEASSGTTTNDKFIMTSGLIDASDGNISLNFWYSADTDGDAVQLTVSVWNGMKWTREFDQNVGNVVPDWINVNLDLSVYTNSDMKIEIQIDVGATGTTWHKDVGIDNIQIIGNTFQSDDITNYFKNSGNFKKSLWDDSFNLSSLTGVESQTIIDSFMNDILTLDTTNYPNGIVIIKNDTTSFLIKG